MAAQDRTLSRYDAIVIGTGQAGKPLALALARAGRRTAVIEREHVGGSCINVGCTPTKTLAASARVAYLAHRAADYGVLAGGVRVDLARAVARKQAVVESFRRGAQRTLEKTDRLDLLFGTARFEDARTVSVRLKEGGEKKLSAPLIVINTGARPARPPIPGIEGVDALDSTRIMELTTLPEHLIVLGGGYVGLEFGQMFRRFGSRVTLIEQTPRLAAREDPDVSEEVAKIFREDGIEVLVSARVTEVGQVNGGSVRVNVETEGRARELYGSHLLVAAGRTPNTDDLNLAAAGVETDSHGYIRVNERLETSAPGIYALGDVKGGPAFTHISYDDFRILRANLLEGGHASSDGRMVPNAVFIDPQLATVGLTETEARAQNRPIRVAKLPMTRVARAIEVGETRGFMKAVVDSESNQILGCTVLGIEGGEVMSMLQIAMMGGIPYQRIKEAVFAHPTLAESLNNLFMTLD